MDDHMVNEKTHKTVKNIVKIHVNKKTGKNERKFTTK